MGSKTIKKIAADIMKSGVSRIRVEQGKEVEEALTREDIRNLIGKGLIRKVQKKGTSKLRVREKQKQKKKGRMKGIGRRKGAKKARTPKKASWIKGIRALRKLLKELKISGQIDQRAYNSFYLRIKGGEFRNKKHLLFYLKDHELLKKRKVKKKPKAEAKKPKPLKK